jgi:hypothetical protein
MCVCARARARGGMIVWRVRVCVCLRVSDRERGSSSLTHTLTHTHTCPCSSHIPNPTLQTFSPPLSPPPPPPSHPTAGRGLNMPRSGSNLLMCAGMCVRDEGDEQDEVDTRHMSPVHLSYLHTRHSHPPLTHNPHPNPHSPTYTSSRDRRKGGLLEKPKKLNINPFDGRHSHGLSNKNKKEI